jgi:hypothetical protein
MLPSADRHRPVEGAGPEPTAMRPERLDSAPNEVLEGVNGKREELASTGSRKSRRSGGGGHGRRQRAPVFCS